VYILSSIISSQFSPPLPLKSPLVLEHGKVLMKFCLVLEHGKVLMRGPPVLMKNPPPPLISPLVLKGKIGQPVLRRSPPVLRRYINVYIYICVQYVYIYW
jgi:hypothetical protein